MRTSPLAAVTVAVLSLSACGAVPAAAPTHSSAVETSPCAPLPTAGMPAVDAAEVDHVEGKVRAVLDAGHYTYAELDTSSGSQWVVVMGELELEPGEAAAFDVLYQRADFRSRRLDRDFDLLLFARLERDA